MWFLTVVSTTQENFISKTEPRDSFHRKRNKVTSFRKKIITLDSPKYIFFFHKIVAICSRYLFDQLEIVFTPRHVEYLLWTQNMKSNSYKLYVKTSKRPRECTRLCSLQLNLFCKYQTSNASMFIKKCLNRNWSYMKIFIYRFLLIHWLLYYENI